jgi:hypothetical protein
LHVFQFHSQIINKTNACVALKPIQVVWRLIGKIQGNEATHLLLLSFSDHAFFPTYQPIHPFSTFHSWNSTCKHSCLSIRSLRKLR